jgi:hypothetical protein
MTSWPHGRVLRVYVQEYRGAGSGHVAISTVATWPSGRMDDRRSLRPRGPTRQAGHAEDKGQGRTAPSERASVPRSHSTDGRCAPIAGEPLARRSGRQVTDAEPPRFRVRVRG